MINYDVPLDKTGQNKNIKGHILEKSKMEELGFWYNDLVNAWVFHRNIVDDIGFHLKLDEKSIQILILDDAFCQHYDYQHALKNVDVVRSRHLPWVQYAVKVHNAVQGYMAKFVEAGVISGYEANDYI